MIKLSKEKRNSGVITEFKKFVMRGNVIDLAVGIIIGGAFQAIVNSAVNDIIMPLISLLTKGIDFSNLFIVIDGGEYDTLAKAQEAGAAVLSYGNFISAVLNFLIMAVVIFFIVRAINKINEIGKKEKETAPAAPTTKKCPYCKSEIDIEATKCPHCTSDIND